jgi:phage repressor protein C with HTH and peptisase S24 domain
MIDSRLLAKESGRKLNYSMCEVVMISGNSMSPEYRHGDRVIIDKADTELADGHIFAFRYQGQCYVKEINLLGNRIKCISLNKEYDPFYINEDEDFLVFGRIIPRIRL